MFFALKPEKGFTLATWRLERAKRTGVRIDFDLTVKSGIARSTRSKSKGFLTQRRKDAKKNSFRDEWDGEDLILSTEDTERHGAAQMLGFGIFTKEKIFFVTLRFE